MRILFVCLGNICRSPMAEAILRHKIALAGLHHQVDSAGTGDWHVGGLADPRTLATLERHGLPNPSRARQVRSDDFEEFDLIVPMDRRNYRDLLRWPTPGGRPLDRGRIQPMMSFAPDAGPDEVPDPYYGGPEGFEEVYRLLDLATDSLLLRLQS